MDALSSFLKSSKTRDALRLGLQSAFAASATFIIIHAFGLPQAFVGVISAVLIVQPSIGATASAGWDRFMATLVGSTAGLICLFLVPVGWGSAAALAVSIFVITFVAGFRPAWRYGVVATVALALAASNGTMDVATDRALSIGVGIVVGIVTSLLVWPDSANARTRRHMRDALAAIARRQDAVLRLSNGDAVEDSRRSFDRALTHARESADRMRGDGARQAQRRLELIEDLYNAIILLRRALKQLDPSEEERDRLRAALKSVNSVSTEIVQTLADGETPTQIEALQTEVERFEAAKEVNRMLTEEQVYSLVFALRELVRDLAAFSDRGDEPDSRFATSAMQEAVPKDLTGLVRN